MCSSTRHAPRFFTCNDQQKLHEDDIPTMTAWLQRQFRPRLECVIRDEHQWNALISAWATWQGFSGKWIADLVADLGGTRLLLPIGQLSYYWPNIIQA